VRRLDPADYAVVDAGDKHVELGLDFIDNVGNLPHRSAASSARPFGSPAVTLSLGDLTRRKIHPSATHP